MRKLLVRITDKSSGNEVEPTVMKTFIALDFVFFNWTRYYANLQLSSRQWNKNYFQLFILSFSGLRMTKRKPTGDSENFSEFREIENDKLSLDIKSTLESAASSLPTSSCQPLPNAEKVIMKFVHLGLLLDIDMKEMINSLGPLTEIASLIIKILIQEFEKCMKLIPEKKPTLNKELVKEGIDTFHSLMEYSADEREGHLSQSISLQFIELIDSFLAAMIPFTKAVRDKYADETMDGLIVHVLNNFRHCFMLLTDEISSSKEAEHCINHLYSLFNERLLPLRILCELLLCISTFPHKSHCESLLTGDQDDKKLPLLRLYNGLTNGNLLNNECEALDQFITDLKECEEILTVEFIYKSMANILFVFNEDQEDDEWLDSDDNEDDDEELLLTGMTEKDLSTLKISDESGNAIQPPFQLHPSLVNLTKVNLSTIKELTDDLFLKLKAIVKVNDKSQEIVEEECHLIQAFQCLFAMNPTYFNTLGQEDLNEVIKGSSEENVHRFIHLLCILDPSQFPSSFIEAILQKLELDLQANWMYPYPTEINYLAALLYLISNGNPNIYHCTWLLKLAHSVIAYHSSSSNQVKESSGLKEGPFTECLEECLFILDVLFNILGDDAFIPQLRDIKNDFRWVDLLNFLEKTKLTEFLRYFKSHKLNKHNLEIFNDLKDITEKTKMTALNLKRFIEYMNNPS